MNPRPSPSRPSTPKGFRTGLKAGATAPGRNGGWPTKTVTGDSGGPLL